MREMFKVRGIRKREVGRGRGVHREREIKTNEREIERTRNRESPFVNTHEHAQTHRRDTENERENPCHV